MPGGSPALTAGPDPAPPATENATPPRLAPHQVRARPPPRLRPRRRRPRPGPRHRPGLEGASPGTASMRNRESSPGENPGSPEGRLGGTSSVREVLGTNRQSRPRAAPRDAQWYVPGRPAGFAPRRRGFLRKGCGHFSEGAWPLQLPDLLSGKHVPERGVVTIEAKSVVIWSQNWVL